MTLVLWSPEIVEELRRNLIDLVGPPMVSAIVTFNTKDFPEHSVEPFGLEVIHPDTFLLDLLDLAPGPVIDELARQAEANRRAPKTVPQLLDALERAGAPGFADEVRRRTA